MFYRTLGKKEVPLLLLGWLAFGDYAPALVVGTEVPALKEEASANVAKNRARRAPVSPQCLAQ